MYRHYTYIKNTHPLPLAKWHVIPFTALWLSPTDAPSYISVVIGSITGVAVYLLTIILIGVVIHFGVKGELWMGSRRKRWGNRRTKGQVMDSTIHGGVRSWVDQDATSCNLSFSFSIP